jgi:phosphoglycerol transferase MdoB-like AlkP superfamily enzyme
MKPRLLFIFSHFFFCTGLFIVAKSAFLIYHAGLTFQYPVSDILRIYLHGLRLDMSVAGYMTIFPLLLMILASFARIKMPLMVFRIYAFITFLILISLTIADMELYKYWGSRLDNTAFRFVNTPGEMIASTSWLTLGIMFAALIISVWGIYYLYNRYVLSFLVNLNVIKWLTSLTLLFLFPVLFLPVRGSLGVAPVNVSSVYFHSDAFPNHAAINVLWNVGHSWLEKKDQPNPYQYIDDKSASFYIDKLFANGNNHIQILNTNRPNVILIVLESFSSKLVERLGGLPGVTPNFNRLCDEGVLFNNLYANDSRTDKSLVSILSGYPALGSISIIKFPEKTRNLGIISRDLLQNGYQTAFYYGGNTDFANMRSYLVNGRFQRVISANDFVTKESKGRWGMPDHVTFQQLFEECDSSRSPFFKVLLTLSNHEPFDIPVKPKFGSETVDDKVCSSAYYADSCIGDFVRKAKQSAWWKNTLIIMVADHGTRFPGNTVLYNPKKYRIPMLWLGGAIKSDTVVTEYCIQSDLARTLLNQLNIDPKDYPLSNDVFGAQQHFAFYEFGSGFGMVSDSGRYVFDNELLKIIEQEGTVSDFFIKAGKALQQEVYHVYLKN